MKRLVSPARRLRLGEARPGLLAEVGGQSGSALGGPRWFAKGSKEPVASQEDYGGKDGERMAREHLHAEVEPQIHKEMSEKGGRTTAGGAYASRDDPLSEAAQPTAGKSRARIIREQTAGEAIHPSKEDKEGHEKGRAAHSPQYAEESMKSAEQGGSPLGDRPHGEE